MDDLLVRRVRVADLDRGPGGLGATAPVDVLVRGGYVAEVGADLPVQPGTPVLDGQECVALPGLWDQHVHMTQWALAQHRLDLSSCTGVAQALQVVRRRLAEGPVRTPTGVLTGWGHRTATWREQPTVAALDEVTGATPVVLISGDGHNGWLNTAAFRLLRVPERQGPVEEGEWFALYARLGDLPGADREGDQAVADAVVAAHRRGVVGVVDLEWARTWEQWARRRAAGVPPLRVRTGVYADRFEEVVAAGWRTGDPLPGGGGLVTMGPLKVISDGSLNTRTAWCCEPYADAASLAHPTGSPNVDQHELEALVRRAHAHGLEAALHAIGDRAVTAALDVFAATGARGSIEHAQLLRTEDLPRWAALAVRASVQPAHLLDDRVVTEQCWPDRTDRTFVLRGLLEHRVPVTLGSDAPVAPLDPWLAMAAAVHRGPTDAPSWHPEQAVRASEALRASVDGRRLRPGEPGDLVLLADDPRGPGGTDGRADSAAQAERLRRTEVVATVLGGRVVWSVAG